LYVHTIDPHAPYDPPLRFRERFAPHVDPAQGSIERLDALVEGKAAPGPGTRDDLLALYDGQVAANDESFGLLLDGLRERGLYDPALVLFTADHGEEFLDHGSWMHGQTLYEEQLAIPFLLKLPDFSRAGTVSAADVEHVDVLPTILGLLGAVPP